VASFFLDVSPARKKAVSEDDGAAPEDLDGGKGG
jgi:hypothetical protein